MDTDLTAAEGFALGISVIYGIIYWVSTLF